MLEPHSPAIDQAILRQRLGSAYAAGSLDGAMRLLVETQAALSDQAREDLALSEALAGALLEAESPAAMRDDALASVFARLDAPAPAGEPAMCTAARQAGAVIDEILHLPRPVQDVALDALGAGGWAFGGPGIRILALPLRDGAKAELLRIEPGWGAPRHGHSGGEYTLVLTGAFVDEFGRYRPGEIAVAGPGLKHRPVAAPGMVCYALAVSEGAPEFQGALGLLQKIWRH
jgi:putative transcriptional regulator